MKSHGYCSQIAVFVRDEAVPRAKRRIPTHSHKLLRDIDYPWAPPKTISEQLLDIIDGECYSLAKELQQVSEEDGRYDEEWFYFSVDQLYESRWRLQNLLPEPDHLDRIREALGKSVKEWLTFSVEKDEVGYKLEAPADSAFNHGDDAADEYDAATQEEQDLFEITVEDDEREQWD